MESRVIREGITAGIIGALVIAVLSRLTHWGTVAPSAASACPFAFAFAAPSPQALSRNANTGARCCNDRGASGRERVMPESRESGKGCRVAKQNLTRGGRGVTATA